MRQKLDRFTSGQPLEPKWEIFGWSSRFRLDGCEFHATIILQMPPVEPPRSPKWLWQVSLPDAGSPPRAGRARTPEAAKEAVRCAVWDMLGEWKVYVARVNAETKSVKSQLRRLRRKKGA
jgi:hypothetical protein